MTAHDDVTAAIAATSATAEAVAEAYAVWRQADAYQKAAAHDLDSATDDVSEQDEAGMAELDAEYDAATVALRASVAAWVSACQAEDAKREHARLVAAHTAARQEAGR